MSRPGNIVGMTTFVLVNIALVTTLDFGLQQLELEMGRVARVEAAIVETRNLVGLYCQVWEAMGLRCFASDQNYRATVLSESLPHPITLKGLESSVSVGSENLETLTGSMLQPLQEKLEQIDEKVRGVPICTFCADHAHKQIKQRDFELLAQFTALKLKETAAQSHQARDIAAQFVRLTLTIAVLFNGAVALSLAVAAIRPRPLFPLALFR
ncbi:MAG: hypothetical protein Q8T09_18440 [Candidatus Melainabacteria bacterium]|nr:hypothetical protein [Candidatus Melainabacteria bacterium]